MSVLKIRRRSGQTVVMYDKATGQQIGRVIHRSGAVIFQGFDPDNIGLVRGELPMREHTPQMTPTDFRNSP